MKLKVDLAEVIICSGDKKDTSIGVLKGIVIWSRRLNGRGANTPITKINSMVEDNVKVSFGAKDAT